MTPVNVVGPAGQNVAFLANASVTVGGVYYATQPTINANSATWMSMTTRAAQIVATGADTFNATINAGLPTGANAIGSVVGRTTSVSVTPTITAVNYTAGWEIGGKMTFAIGGAGSGVLECIRVTSKKIQTTALKLYLFDTDPTNSTWTNAAAPAINALDVPSCIGVFNLTNADNGLGTHTIWNLNGIGYSFVGANLYGILVVVTTTTVAFAVGDVTVKLGIIDD